MTTRRQFLQGSTVALGASAELLPMAAGTTDEDARLASLIVAYQNTNDLLLSFIRDAERQHGILSYELNDELRKHYERILEAKDVIEAEIVDFRPPSLTTLVTKMRIAFYCDHLSQAKIGCINEEILYPALGDLERLVDTS